MARPPPEKRTEAAGWQSRLAAAELLHHTLDKGLDLEAAMDASRTFRRLEGPDRGFARAIAGAALRGIGRIDYALGGMVERPMAGMEPEVRAVLCAGAAQLWMLGVPDHAAVSATVEAAGKWHEARRGGGLVNAVLRRASREAQAFHDAPPTSVWPEWMAAKLKSALGPERADAMARLQLEEPPVDITLKPVADPHAWAKKLNGVVLPSGSIRLASGAGLTDLPGYADGVWWVQDAAAALPARLMGDIAGKRVADLCAAPGGKTMQLAAAGASVTAIEISRQRMTRLRENIERSRLPVTIVEQDARTWRPAELLDAILLDAPCSALGILRRHPEGAWRRDPKDMARFPATQTQLVQAAAEMLRPGGRLIYSVCTPTSEEGRDIVEAALATGSWRRVKITPEEVHGFEAALTDDGDLITAPQALAEARVAAASAVGEIVAEPMKSDIFYIARLERA
ncbi:MAG: RsmB/NOP family class I SAM-dependent RNA methyltransferase [Hyphomonadaceae bacterium]|nr:RsmB/NOP family class I SAM-dependent RNA methyltransferase [Hyphomonadaceae bacterium]